jgi:hypothetical protein
MDRLETTALFFEGLQLSRVNFLQYEGRNHGHKIID